MHKANPREAYVPDPRWNGGEPINSFALVSYITSPLGRFVDDLRRELVPGYATRAHVTVLPPRPLTSSSRTAWSHMLERLQDKQSFEVEATRVAIFDTTSAIYLDLGEGEKELRKLHDELNEGPSGWNEPFIYHPHITLAQGITSQDEVARAFRIATRRWNAFSGKRSFSVDKVTFVQNTNRNQWLDLTVCRLGLIPREAAV